VNSYYGDRCEFYNPCWSSPCQHGATCLNLIVGTFRCQCQTGYYGPTCADIDGCASSPCQNGALCRNTSATGNYECACAAGYVGPTCAEYDPCSEQSLSSLFYCSAVTLLLASAALATPYAPGEIPFVEYDPCSKDGPGAQCISNGGTCRPVSSPGRVELYVCDCPPGFYDRDCSQFNPCSSAPCFNGATCVILSGVQYRCTCAEGYAGRFCERRAPCESSPCRNGATCVETGGENFRCACAAGYYGNACDQGNACLLATSAPCLNGGTCRNTSSFDFRCDCTPGYYGPRCDSGYNPCAASDDLCLNGGSCYNVTTGSGFVCACAGGYYGERCASFDPCARQPCLNAAGCRNLTNSRRSCGGPGFCSSVSTQQNLTPGGMAVMLRN